MVLLSDLLGAEIAVRAEGEALVTVRGAPASSSTRRGALYGPVEEESLAALG